MKLVLFTNTYPYGHDESFVANELRIAEQKFEHIYIICRKEKKKGHIQYIPNNATVIERDNSIGVLVRAMLASCSFASIRDIWYSHHALKQKVNLYTLKKIVDAKVNAFSAAKLAKKFPASKDYVVYSYWLDGLAWGAIRFGQEVKSHTIVARAHGVDCFVARGYQPFRREMLHHLKAVYSVSEAGANDIIEHVVSTTNQEKRLADVKVGRLGVFGGAPNPEKKDASIVVVTCSHIIGLKRLDLLIDALALIDDISAEWIHIGAGELAEQIKEYAKAKLGHKVNITYRFMGKLSNEVVRGFYETQSIDVFVNCSDYEGLPVSIMEAMAHGIPVLARDVGGNNEIVNNQAGWLLTNEDPHAIADIIASLANMKDKEIQEKRKSALDTWERKFSAENNYNKFYEEIMSI